MAETLNDFHVAGASRQVIKPVPSPGLANGERLTPPLNRPVVKVKEGGRLTGGGESGVGSFLLQPRHQVDDGPAVGVAALDFRETVNTIRFNHTV